MMKVGPESKEDTLNGATFCPTVLLPPLCGRFVLSSPRVLAREEHGLRIGRPRQKPTCIGFKPARVIIRQLGLASKLGSQVGNLFRGACLRGFKGAQLVIGTAPSFL